jgi:hypothetical protein
LIGALKRISIFRRFFQENLKVGTSMKGKLSTKRLSPADAAELFAQPSALIKFSRQLAYDIATAERGDINTHHTNSYLVLDVLQCQSSGGWIPEHRGQDNSWRT